MLPALSLLTAAALVFAATPASADLGHPATPDVVVASATGDRSTWFPTVERLHSGELVVVYYDATSHIGPSGRIALTRSRDGGRTWSAPTVAIDTALDDRDPSLVELHDGTLLMNWFQTDWSTAPPTPGGVWTARSRDGGRTWSAPVRARSGVYGEGQWQIPPVGYATPWVATSAKVLELPDHTLLLPLYGNTPTDSAPSITILRSADGGRTWPTSLEVPAVTHPVGNGFNEPALARTADGVLHMAIRSSNVGYWTTSRDNGRTWAPATAISEYWEQASDLVPLAGGGLLQTWGDRSGAFGPGRPTVGRLITAAGVRETPRVIYSGGAFDESYPSTVQVGHGRFFTVYYDAARKIIGGTYSRLSDY